MIVARVLRTIRERALLEGGERVLVACSGGPDSAALLHALHRLAGELSITLFAASVDHGLRASAAHDVEIARALARSLDVPFTALRVEIPKEGASIMSKARRARYDALFAHAKAIRATAVAVGHTRDDQAETVLLRAIRGSGVTGLSGIEPRRKDGVVRPLLDCARAEVHAHVAHHGLPFVQDPSNEDAAYARVRVRRDLLPLLLREDPRAIEHLAQLADDARALRALVRSQARALLELAAAHGDLASKPLLEAPPAIRAEALAQWVLARTGRTASRAHVQGLERTLQGRGETLLPGELVARLEANVLRAEADSAHPTRSRPEALLTPSRGVRSKEEG